MSTTRTIWKFPLEVTEIQYLKMPRAHEWLTVAMQGSIPCAWAIVLPEEKRETAIIRMYGTGHGSPQYGEKYLGTVHVNGYVWHYFEAFE